MFEESSHLRKTGSYVSMVVERKDGERLHMNEQKVRRQASSFRSSCRSSSG
jgi:hypothetical protein